MTLAVKHPWLWIALFLLTALFVFHFAASSAAAQAVQLPTFHFFTTNTTVEVPDGGEAFLGGVGRASSGRIRARNSRLTEPAFQQRHHRPQPRSRGRFGERANSRSRCHGSRTLGR